jgi:uroporphyrinogen III methyltransferase/synthase
MVQRQDLRPPAVIVVGEVVSLRKELSWFEKRPLFGRRILVTRARSQAGSLVELLADLGAECIQFPTIEVVPPHTWEPLDRAAASIGRYSWVLFTSVNGVRFFFERMEVKGLDARALGGVKIGAIGPATAESLRMKGIIADLIPGEYRAEAVVEALGRGSIRGAEILIPRAEKAREILPMELERMGAKVEVVPAYRTVLPEADTDRIRSMLEQGRIDMVTFTSSSTVSNFAGMFPHEEQGRLKEWMQAAAVACIGPITARTAEEKGFPVTVVPSEYTIEGLAGAVCEYFSQKGPAGS